MTTHFPLSHFTSPTTGAPPFGSVGVRMQFAAGEEMYAQDEEAELVYMIIRGVVRTTRLQADGRRQIGDFYYAGEFVGLETTAEHRFSAEAITDCVVLVVKRASLRHYGEEGERIEQMIWEATFRELQRTQDHLFLLGRKTACEKVGAFLLSTADRSSDAVATLAMSRQDMADYLGLTIETVSRMLTQLQADGVVQFLNCRNFKVRNRDQLEDLAAN